MQYTCIRGFVAKGYDPQFIPAKYSEILKFAEDKARYKIGQTINRTQYIALTAEERGNFKEDFKPLKAR